MLPANLDTRAAPALHEALMAFDGQPLTLDGSQVESLGGQCLQILLAAHEAWGKQETQFAIENSSDALTLFCRTCSPPQSMTQRLEL